MTRSASRRSASHRAPAARRSAPPPVPESLKKKTTPASAASLPPLKRGASGVQRVDHAARRIETLRGGPPAVTSRTKLIVAPPPRRKAVGQTKVGIPLPPAEADDGATVPSVMLPEMFGHQPERDEVDGSEPAPSQSSSVGVMSVIKLLGTEQLESTAPVVIPRPPGQAARTFMRGATQRFVVESPPRLAEPLADFPGSWAEDVETPVRWAALDALRTLPGLDWVRAGIAKIAARLPVANQREVGDEHVYLSRLEAMRAASPPLVAAGLLVAVIALVAFSLS